MDEAVGTKPRERNKLKLTIPQLSVRDRRLCHDGRPARQIRYFPRSLASFATERPGEAATVAR